jgi:hypothetical protein
LQDIQTRLREVGADVRTGWQHTFRLTFETGEKVARFLRETGIASHPLLEQLPANAAELLWRRFAEEVEIYRGAQGIPLDFELAGVVAEAGPR